MAAEEGDVFPVICTLSPLDDDLGARRSDLRSSVSSRVWRQIMARLNLNFDRFSIELEPGLVPRSPRTPGVDSAAWVSPSRRSLVPPSGPAEEGRPRRPT